MTAHHPLPIRAKHAIISAILLFYCAFIIFCWLTRIGSDLSWDETHNYRMYARHPLVAISLYLEPNNHPLDSLFKSLFYWGLHLQTPPFYRFPGVILVGICIWLLWKWFKFFETIHRPHSGIIFVGLFLISTGVNDQVMNLRGYFPSMLLGMAYLLALFSTRFIMTGAGALLILPLPYSRREYIIFSILSSALIFTVPTNLICAIILWTISASFQFIQHPSDWRHSFSVFCREWGRFACISLAFSFALYAPILTGGMLGINRIDSPAGDFSFDLMRSIVEEPVTLLCLLKPVKTSGYLFGAIFTGWLIIAATRIRSSLFTRVGIVLLSAIVVCAMLFATSVNLPFRVKTPLTPLLCLAVAFLGDGVAQSLKSNVFRRYTILFALLIGGVMLPRIKSATTINQDASNVALFLETLFATSKTETLICHGDHALSFPLWKAFSPRQVIDGAGDLPRTFSGTPQLRVSVDSPLKRRLFLFFFPEYLAVEQVRPNEIQRMVVIISRNHPENPLDWDSPELSALRARLFRRATYHIGSYYLLIFE